MRGMWNLVFVILLVAVTSNSDAKITYDEKHLKFDFADIIGNVMNILSGSEMDFRYFTAHDFDKNSKLDGLELLTAMSHGEEGHEEQGGGSHDNSIASVEKEIDDILKSHDLNADGFLDYKEFAKAQKGRPELSSDDKEL